MSPPEERTGPGRPPRRSLISLDACPELDPDSQVPRYYQLAAILFEALEAEEPEPGTPFPTERQLEKRFSVSRAVVRDALKLLVGDGVIIRTRGQGSRIAPKRRLLRPHGLIEILTGDHDRFSLEILDTCTHAPRAAIATQLELKPNAEVASVMCLLLVDGERVGLIESHSAPVLSPFVLASTRAFHAGARTREPNPPKLTRSSVRIEQTCLGPWGGPKFGSSAGDPALMAHLVQFGVAGRSKRERPLEYAHLIYPSHSVKLTADYDCGSFDASLTNAAKPSR